MVSQKSVLLVEDDPDLLDYACELLRRMGYYVIPVDNATQALKLIEEGLTVDLLFSDIRLPGAMDGVALARQVSVLKPDTKVLLVSGYDKIFLDESLRGQFPFLEKPYYSADLKNAVQSLIGAA